MEPKFPPGARAGRPGPAARRPRALVRASISASRRRRFLPGHQSPGVAASAARRGARAGRPRPPSVRVAPQPRLLIVCRCVLRLSYSDLRGRSRPRAPARLRAGTRKSSDSLAGGTAARGSVGEGSSDGKGDSSRLPAGLWVGNRARCLRLDVAFSRRRKARSRLLAIRQAGAATKKKRGGTYFAAGTHGRSCHKLGAWAESPAVGPVGGRGLHASTSWRPPKGLRFSLTFADRRQTEQGGQVAGL